MIEPGFKKVLKFFERSCWMNKPNLIFTVLSTPYAKSCENIINLGCAINKNLQKMKKILKLEYY